MMRTVRHTRTEIARNNETLAELESKILDAAKQPKTKQESAKWKN